MLDRKERKIWFKIKKQRRNNFTGSGTTSKYLTQRDTRGRKLQQIIQDKPKAETEARNQDLIYLSVANKNNKNNKQETRIMIKAHDMKTQVHGMQFSKRQKNSLIVLVPKASSKTCSLSCEPLLFHPLCLQATLYSHNFFNLNEVNSDFSFFPVFF